MRYEKPLFSHLASSIDARRNCIARNSVEWEERHEETIDQLAGFLPHGSGVDCGCKIDLDASTGEKIVINTSFHHMNENGMYDGWTEHTITVTPSLIHGISLSISGRNRNDIKEYLHDLFHTALTDIIDYDEKEQQYFSPAMRAAQAEYQRRIASGEIR